MTIYDLLKRPVVLLDVETSGLSPRHDRVIELAAIRIGKNGTAKELSTVVRPNPVPKLVPGIVELTGITQAEMEQGRDSFGVFQELEAMLDDQPVIIGHNVAFDIGFVVSELDRHGLTPWDGDFICTRALATFLGKGIASANRAGKPYTSYQLHHVCEALGIKLEGAHRALNDLLATEQALLKMWPVALREYKPILNAMVRPEWAKPGEYTPPRAVVYLVA